MQSWQTYNEKFAKLSTREQALIMLTGMIVIVFLAVSFALADIYKNLGNAQQQHRQLLSENNNIQNIIVELENALRIDPNIKLKQEIKVHQQELAIINESLLELTSELVDPIQMRQALEQLLQMQKGVRLVSFAVSSGQPLVLSSAPVIESDTNKEVEQSNIETLGLYRHVIKLKLTGSYFKLQDYLTQLETLPWKFFWEKFDYQLKKYPKSELELEIYSLSLKQEFVGA